jgi:penicillin-binding protein 2
MDPDTGAIEAIASYPTFDPSLFSRSISTEEFDRRFGASTGYPLLNRAIYGEYPPGSTYKPWVALSGLSRGLLSTDRYYPCPPSWTVPYDETDPEAIQYVFDNWTSANLGSMNLRRRS